MPDGQSSTQLLRIPALSVFVFVSVCPSWCMCLPFCASVRRRQSNQQYMCKEFERAIPPVHAERTMLRNSMLGSLDNGCWDKLSTPREHRLSGNQSELRFHICVLRCRRRLPANMTPTLGKKHQLSIKDRTDLPQSHAHHQEEQRWLSKAVLSSKVDKCLA